MREYGCSMLIARETARKMRDATENLDIHSKISQGETERSEEEK